MSLRAHIADIARRNDIVRAARLIIAAPVCALTSGAVATMSRSSAGATVS